VHSRHGRSGRRSRRIRRNHGRAGARPGAQAGAGACVDARNQRAKDQGADSRPGTSRVGTPSRSSRTARSASCAGGASSRTSYFCTAAVRTRIRGISLHSPSGVRPLPLIFPGTKAATVARITTIGHGRTPLLWRRCSNSGPRMPEQSSACPSVDSPRSAWHGSRPDLVRQLVVVDVTPGVMHHNAQMTREERGTIALIQDEQVFDSREEKIERAIQASPKRPLSAVRRGVIHNTRQLADGRWTWRYDRIGRPGERSEDFEPLWDDLEALEIPVMLVRSGASAFVSDADAAAFARRQRSARIEVVADAGHSLQSDQPVALSRLIADFVLDSS
jgi:hypothetical protein